jgi:outer membrane lipoprotein-sorting protein
VIGTKNCSRAVGKMNSEFLSSVEGMAKLVETASITNKETSAAQAFHDTREGLPESSGRAFASRSCPIPERWWSAVKIFSAVCLIFMGLGGCVEKNSLENVSLDKLINSMERKSYLIKQFRAEFVKVRRSPVFRRDLTVKGRLLFQRPSKFSLTMSGDANIEILSDGENINLIHNKRDSETYHLAGERDISKFADPLMMVIQSIGDGGMRRFSLTKKSNKDGSVILDATPNGQVNFERIERAEIAISDIGEIQRVSLLFKDGNRDETIFRSWALLAQDDPVILELNSRLENLSQNSRVARQAPHGNDENAEIPAMVKPLISFRKSTIDF